MSLKPDSRRRNILLGAALVTPWLVGRKGLASSSELAPLVQPNIASDAAFIELAFDMQRQAMTSGDQAYGAILVRDGVVVGQSPSQVVVNHDPTAHAEMEAIRDTARRLGRRDLSGCTLYSSSRACPMCEAAAYWANIERMVYGRDASDGGSPGLC